MCDLMIFAGLIVGRDYHVGRDYQKVIVKILKKIKPTKKEEIKDQEFIKNFVGKLDKLTPTEINVKLAGSMAKGTSLKEDKDFDVFLLFPKTYSVTELTKYGLQWAKKAVKGNRYEIAYAQHPYLRAWIEGNEVDIVPSYNIKTISERMTAVDRSPLHTGYVNNNLNDKKKDGVRLLKQFLKGIGIYGAEGKIQGFSGYLCELLIIKYKSFLNLLDEASNWKGIPVIDIEKNRGATELTGKFPDAAMIFMDPVDEHRNVAAAVSKTSLSLFIYSGRRFLKKSSTRFFFPVMKKFDKKWMQRQIKNRNTLILGFEFEKPTIVDDILWPQLYKFASKVSKIAAENDFSVLDSDVTVDNKNNKCTIIFEFEIFELPKIKRVIGPPLWLEKEVYSFMKKHKVTEPIWFSGDKILSLATRRQVRVEDLLKEIIRKAEIYGVPPDIKKAVKTKSFKMLNVDSITKRYPQFLFSYLKTRNM